MSVVHPVFATIRLLRQKAGLSLVEAGVKIGMSAIALGSYERGDRNPPLYKVEEILNSFGYTVVAVPTLEEGVWLPVAMAVELRRIADEIEAKAGA